METFVRRTSKLRQGSDFAIVQSNRKRLGQIGKPARMMMLLGIWLTIIWLLLAQMVSTEHLCDDGGKINTYSFNERDNRKPQTIASTSTSTNTSSEEWIFEGAADAFLTVEFTQFNLSGPKCDEETKGYSTVKLETTLSVVQPYYLFCKDRRSPVGEQISSMGRLRIAYCNQYFNGKIEFKVIPGCNATLLARKTHTQLSVQKKKTICSIHLKTLGTSGINARLSGVSMKVNKKMCQRAFISVKESKVNMQKSLLHDGKERICSSDAHDPIEGYYDFQTLMQDIIITYRNAAFTLKFMELSLNETATIPSQIAVAQGTIGRSINGSGRANDSLPVDQVVKGQGSMTLITALGCGGLLILLVIIATLVYLKRRTTKSRSSKESTKRRTRGSSAISEDVALVRAQSVCSIDNAMYGRLVSGGGTVETMTGPDRRNNSRRQRLAQLEEKYGPFPETSTSFLSPASTENAKLVPRADTPAAINYYHAQNTAPESEHKLFQKGIRPLLPLPTVMSSSSAQNEYETIEDVHQRNASTVAASNHRLSHASMTSDEFSDDDVPVAAAIIYATILDGPVVSYDQVQEEQLQIPVAEYEPAHSSMQVPEVKYHTKMATNPLNAPVIDVHPPPRSATTALTESTSVLNDIDFQYQTPNRATRKLLVPDKNSEKLQGVIRNNKRNCVNDYLAPRPSLPEIRQGNSCISSVNSLQEDAENYLRPRPSCPDAMITCAYSSTEDLSDIRRRLLAAAHPSLLDSQNNISSNEDVSDKQTTVSYDSPRPSSSNLQPQYVSPRRQDKFNPST